MRCSGCCARSRGQGWSGEVATFDTVESELKVIEGIRVPVVTPSALYRLKRITVGPLDRQDAAAIRDRFKLNEEGGTE